MQAFFSLLSKIEKGQYAPIYLLSGAEPYYIDALSNALIKQLVNDQNRDFDHSLLYGKETNAAEIIEVAKRFPMLSSYNLVVVKEAQQLPASSFEELTQYAAHPASESIVVLCYKYKTFDKRKKLYKAIEQKGEVFTAQPLYDNQIPQWIKEQTHSLQLKLTPTAVELLSTYVGSNLSRLSSELKKIKLVVERGALIDEQAIERYVGISKEFNSFELQKAIGVGNFSQAFQIIQYLCRNQKANPLVLILSSLHAYFQKLLLLKGTTNSKQAASKLGISPYFLKEYEVAANRFSMRQISQAMHFIFKADLKSKGIEGSSKGSKELLEELLLRLFTL